MITLLIILNVVVLLYFLCKWWDRNRYSDPPNGTVYEYYDEHSPESMDLEEAAKRTKLKNETE